MKDDITIAKVAIIKVNEADICNSFVMESAGWKLILIFYVINVKIRKDFVWALPVTDSFMSS